ncbi:MAG TPA: hypothetical protein VIM79_07515 [Niastella sp.]
MLRGAQRLAVLIFLFSMVCLFSAWCNLLKKNAGTPAPVVNPTSQVTYSLNQVSKH